MTHYRLPGHDYRRGFHFITISTQPRRDILSRIENGHTFLTPIGEIVQRALDETLARYSDLHIITQRIMPNHVHFVFEHLKPLPRHLGQIIGYFKSRVTHYISVSGLLSNPHIFEENYHDIVALDRKHLDEFVYYVEMNPMRWQWKHDHPEYWRKHYDVVHNRLPEGTSWTAIGDQSLLDWPRLIPVIVSRKEDASNLDAIVWQYIQKLYAGYTLVSGFISPGEKAVLKALPCCQTARVIVLMPYGLAHYQPHGKAIERLVNGRTLVLSGFPEDVPITPISRKNCLQNNLWIKEICRGRYTPMEAEGATRP